jgi:glutathione synthase
MQKQIAIQMDNIETIDFEFDTSFLIGFEAQQRNYKIFYYNPNDLIIQNGDVQANGQYVKLKLDENNYFEYISKRITVDLKNFNFIFLRQDPPFNMNYITSTYILDLLPDSTKVINNPTAVRNATEKLFTFNFKKFMPPTIVTNNINEIENFLDKIGEIITKPLYGNGGVGIHRFNKQNFNPDDLKQYLDLPIMAQKYIKEINQGDRRLILIDGEYCGSVARIPKDGDIKANFHAGGKAKKTDLVFRDREIIESLGPQLVKNNLFFVGIDIIGDYLTEINVTSPTGIKQINTLNNVNLEKLFWDKLEAKYKLV